MGRPDNVPDAGIPNDETDALWNDLFNCEFLSLSQPYPFLSKLMLIRPFLVGVSQIPLSQARLLPNATELIPGTSEEYIIELDVFHQLHCLNAVRKSLYPERYWETYDDYYIDDGSAPGRGQRNYTSTDAKHLGNFNPFLFVIPVPALSKNTLPNSYRTTKIRDFDKQITASMLSVNPSCVTVTLQRFTGVGWKPVGCLYQG